MLLRSIFFFWLMLCFSSALYSREVPARDTLDISRYKVSQRIRSFCLWYKDSLNNISEDHLDQINFTDVVPHSINSISLVNKTIYLTCVIRNNEDSLLRDYFNPGFYFRVIRVFEFDSLTGKTKLLPNYPGEAEGFKLIYLEPHSSKQFYFKLRSIRSDIKFEPSLVPDYFHDSFLLKTQQLLKYTNIITYIISGILLMMIFYSLAVY
ncbi:MAG: hypothetical protein ABI151_12760, partial [Chitinophagaceae bacterium]